MILGENIYLDAVRYKDLEKILFWRNNPIVYQWFYEHEPTAIEQQIKWYENILTKNDEKFWSINLLRTGEIIGVIGLIHIDWRNRKAEFGRFFIFPQEYIHIGLGKEALQLLIDYFFNHMNMHKLYCDTFSDNIPAIKLYEKIGFVQTGLFKEHIYRKGKYEDLIYFELTKGKN